MTTGVERRAFTRNSPADHESFVWIMDYAVERMIRARLLNVSSGGALIETYRPIATGRAIRVGLENSPNSGWLAAVVVWKGRSQEVGIRFHPPGQSAFVLAASNGIKPWRPADRNDSTTWATEAKPILKVADEVD